jgi:hypothetical protein
METDQPPTAEEWRAEAERYALEASTTTDALAIHGLCLSARHAKTMAANMERESRGLPPLET